MTLLKIAVVSIFAYVGLVILQRITGKRTLSKMNAFDLVVTVALGSALATTILSKTTAIGRSDSTGQLSYKDVERPNQPE